MKDVFFPLPALNDPSCGTAMEEALSLYVDGELSLEAQPILFAHLASCEACRRTLAGVLEFRRLSRQEVIAVPPAVDDAIMERLAKRKSALDRVDRAADRRPLWQARTPVSLRAAAVVALVVFFLGLLIPHRAAPPAPTTSEVQGEEERVRFQERIRVAEAVYVIYPGLTIEAFKAARGEERPSGEPL